MKAETHRHCRRRGFTLWEVLAVLVLAGIVLPAVMRAISVTTGAASDARRRMEAASLAETRMDELVTTGAWQDENLSGDFGTDWPQYRWMAEVSDWDGLTLRLLSVHVQWTAKGVQREVVLSTLVSTGSE